MTKACADPTHVKHPTNHKCSTCQAIRSREWRKRMGSSVPMRKKQRNRLYSQLLRAWK